MSFLTLAGHYRTPVPKGGFMSNRFLLPAVKSALSASRHSLPYVFVLLALASAGMGGCAAGGGHNGGGHGAANKLIDLTSDVTVDNRPDSPNLTFTDGTNATLHFTISNSGNLPSDQTITVTVGLPSGLT